MPVQNPIRKLKSSPAVIGWTAAAVLTVVGTVSVIVNMRSPLSLMLSVDGNDICCVQSSDTVDEAILKLDDKLASIGGFGNHKIEYSFVRGNNDVCDVPECMNKLYDISTNSYRRAYIVSAGGTKLGICATYNEAHKLMSDFKEYVKRQVSSYEETTDSIELTTEFGIKNDFCSASEITSPDSIYFNITGEMPPESASSAQIVSDSRVTADGIDAYKNADKNVQFGITRNASCSADGNMFSIEINNVIAEIEYNTVSTEKFSEIIPYEIEFIETDDLYVGESEVIQEGENGIAENEYYISYSDGVEIGRELISSVILSPAKNRIERIGTKAYPSTEPTGTFIVPVKGRRIITTYFGMCYDADGNLHDHLGIDLAGMQLGSDIYAADGGTVIFVGDDGAYGLTVRIRHEDEIVTLYSHLGSINVSYGDKVYKGQKIGEAGLTGRTTGVHLHFEVRIKDNVVDPLLFLPKI